MNLSLVKYHFRLIYRCRGGESGEVLDSEDWSTGTMCVTSLFLRFQYPEMLTTIWRKGTKTQDYSLSWRSSYIDERFSEEKLFSILCLHKKLKFSLLAINLSSKKLFLNTSHIFFCSGKDIDESPSGFNCSFFSHHTKQKVQLIKKCSIWKQIASTLK